MMCVYRKHGGQRGYKGHVINFHQDIQGFLNKLPCSVKDLPLLIVRRHGADNTHKDFKVKRQNVLTALQWLKLNNPCYKDIIIDMTSIASLPVDGVPAELISIHEDDDNDDNEVQSQTEDDVPKQTSSFLPNPMTESTEDKAIRSMIDGDDCSTWPNIDQSPVNEFHTPYLATLAFPTLFPYGQGDPTYPGRQRAISLTDGLKHLLRYGELTSNNQWYWRFASHPRFPYWGLNMKQRHQLLGQANVYLQQHPEDANLTVENMKEMVDQLSSEQLMKRLQRYAAKVQGTSQYWFQRYLELRALLDQKGPPTFFWTVSAADCHWPELHNLLPHSNTPPSYSDRIQAIINVPHLTDWYFTSNVQHWLYDTLDSAWHWYRLEYQARGSTHAHGCAKLKNDPGICALVHKAASAWLVMQDQGNLTDSDLHQIVQDGEDAKTTVLQYVDWLVTTCNSSLPGELSSTPIPHPCSVPPCDISDIDEDYHMLVNTVQSTAYCLRRKPGQQETTCRFEYPREEQTSSTITFERLESNTVRATLISKRNDPRLNSHNRVMLQHWRANVDVQIIVDVQACARYMAKYSAKGEPRSQSVQSVYKACIERIHDTDNATKALRSALLSSVGERDFSAQECSHMLLSLPLFCCTYSFVTVALNGSRKLTREEDSAELVLQNSLLDDYSIRHASLADLNLCQFISTYRTVNGKNIKRSAPVIVRTFPSLSSNSQSQLYDQYCKYQLIKYRPWTTNPSNAWRTSIEETEDFVTIYSAD